MFYILYLHYKMIEMSLQKKVRQKMFSTLEQVEIFLKKRSKFGIKLGLDRITYMLESMDHPETTIDYVHVAGTNGKGSTIQYLKNMLIENDYDVGVFTSPSLEGMRGHININNERISSENLLSIVNTLYPTIEKLDQQNDHPTEFEIITVIAFTFFAKKAQIALIETGMGGRFDTTNVIHPLMSIITNVELDHTQFLGQTLKDIAFEKAGIMKQKSPVIIGDIRREAYEVIEDAAKKVNASIFRLQTDFHYHNRISSDHNQSFSWSHESSQYAIEIRQSGVHQVKNCSLALMAAKLLTEQGYHLRSSLCMKGLEKTSIPGRFELIHDEPKVIVDGAHNVAGVKAFLKIVEEHYDHVPKTLIFGAFRDKNIQEMLHNLIPHFSKVILMSFDHPRAATASELATYAESISVEKNIMIMSEHELHTIFDEMSVKTKNNHYFFTGSLFFITKIKELFEIR